MTAELDVDVYLIRTSKQLKEEFSALKAGTLVELLLAENADAFSGTSVRLAQNRVEYLLDRSDPKFPSTVVGYAYIPKHDEPKTRVFLYMAQNIHSQYGPPTMEIQFDAIKGYRIL